jgi:hypothetical protein
LEPRVGPRLLEPHDHTLRLTTQSSAFVASLPADVAASCAAALAAANSCYAPYRCASRAAPRSEPQGCCRAYQGRLGGLYQSLTRPRFRIRNLAPECGGLAPAGVMASSISEPRNLHGGTGACGSESYAGMALCGPDGAVYTGGSIESCAYNPTMAPLQTALVAATAGGLHDWSHVAHAVLVELPSARVKVGGPLAPPPRARAQRWVTPHEPRTLPLRRVWSHLGMVTKQHGDVSAEG